MSDVTINLFFFFTAVWFVVIISSDKLQSLDRNEKNHRFLSGKPATASIVNFTRYVDALEEILTGK